MTLVWQPGWNRITEQEAADYIFAVEAADAAAGSPGGLEPGVVIAFNDFVAGCKSDGIWSAIKACCILAGARTLAGALVPLVGTAPDSFGFVDTDYDRKTGLKGNGSTKYLDTKRAENADPQNNNHMATWISEDFGPGQYVLSGTQNAAFTAVYRGSTAGGNRTVVYNKSLSFFAEAVFFVSGPGLAGSARTSSTAVSGRVFGTSTTAARTSSTSNSTNYFVFAAAGTSSGRGSGRISFYSIGESLDLELLDARVTALMAAIGAAIP